jgi:hypothetical protein
MQGDTQIRVHKISKNASLKKRPGARGLERPLHDAMELGMVTIEILGIPVYTRSFW